MSKQGLFRGIARVGFPLLLLTVTCQAQDPVSAFLLSVASDMAKDAVKAGAKALFDGPLNDLGLIDTHTDTDRFNYLSAQLSFLDWVEKESYIATALTNGQLGYAELQKPSGQRNLNTLDVYTQLGARQMSNNPAVYYRVYNSSDTSRLQSINVSLASITKNDPQNPKSAIYDWRLGMPVFLTLLAYRLEAIAALHPGNVAPVRVELEGYLKTLSDQYNLHLSNAVQTGSADEGSCGLFGCTDKVYFATDTYSGARVLAWHEGPNNWWGPSEPGINLLDRYAAAQRDLNQKLPFFEVKAMINLLTLYLHPKSDLTQATKELMLYAAPSLCMQANRVGQTGPADFYLYNAVLGKCNGSTEQKWFYNRIDGTVRNPYLGSPSSGGVCLAVGSSTVVYEGDLALKNALPVVIAACSGSRQQKWTWDSVSRQLLSPVGHVLDVKWDYLQAGTMLWTWPPNGSSAQLWDDLRSVIVY